MGTGRSHPQLGPIPVSVYTRTEETEFCCFWLLVREPGNHFNKLFTAPPGRGFRGEGWRRQWGQWWRALPVRPSWKERWRASPAGRYLSAISSSVSIALPICSHYLVNPHPELSCEESRCHHPVCTRGKQTHTEANHKACLLVRSWAKRWRRHGENHYLLCPLFLYILAVGSRPQNDCSKETALLLIVCAFLEWIED